MSMYCIIFNLYEFMLHQKPKTKQKIKTFNRRPILLKSLVLRVCVFLVLWVCVFFLCVCVCVCLCVSFAFFVFLVYSSLSYNLHLV